MNKLDFLRRLDKELAVLDKEERREILAFYEERFYTGTIYENKTEEEVIAELERPEVIARNVLEEYGVSPKFVKKTEERYSNLDVTQVVMLIVFDVIIASWIIPTLFSVAFSIFGASFSYIGTFGLLLGERTTVDEFVFAFLTAGYILLFLFGIVVLGAAIYVTKKIVIWHLNVFKFRNRDKWIKKLSRVSTDGWFKRHRKWNTIKNLALVGSLVTIIYSGLWIFNHYDWVEAEYGSGTVQNEIITEDFTAELLTGDEWNIVTDFESMDVEIVLTSGDEITIKHSYYEDDEFTYDFDYDTNTLTLTNDLDNAQFFLNFIDIIRLATKNYTVRIEVPNTLVLDEITIHSTNGDINVRNVDANTVEVQTTNSEITLTNMNIEDDMTAHSTNGTIYVKDITVALNGVLDLELTNGNIDVENTNFMEYYIDTTNGSINLTTLNDTIDDGDKLVAESTNGNITLENVYVDDINVDTTNGNIDYQNEDTTYMPTKLEMDKTNGNISTNVR